MKLWVKGIGKKFFPGIPSVATLENINLEIREGEFVCILGPSGCGKSTLLNIIAGLEKPTTGAIYFQGQQVKGPGPERILMFQESALFPWLSVIQNIEFGLEMAGIPKLRRKNIARHFLHMVKLADYENSSIDRLSGGMKQRVALARALAVDSEILLMDEPFAALDPETRKSLHFELLDIWRKTGKTVIFVTHSIEEALILGDRVLVMGANPGRIKKEFLIPYPRPRNLELAYFKGLSKTIQFQLRQEGSSSLKEEGSSDRFSAENTFLLQPGRSLGRSI